VVLTRLDADSAIVVKRRRSMYVRLWRFVAVVMYEVVEEAEKVVGVIKVRGTKIKRHK